MDAIITFIVIIGAMLLFVTEKLSVDVVALLIIGALVSTGVISTAEGIAGFSNPATLTVAFMFVLSAAILKTGSLQYLSGLLTKIFRNRYQRGVILLMAIVSGVSAFINNTPVVAVMIPVTTQIAKNSNHTASKLLIPISYASIFGGTCTLIGTSTNILVNGIAVQHGLQPFGMFDFAPMGLCFVAVGSIFMIVVGQKLLPMRKGSEGSDLDEAIIDYLAEIEILPSSELANSSILSSPLVKELDMEILELRRNNTEMILPQGDTLLVSGDILKIRCNLNKLKQMKDRLKVKIKPVDADELEDSELDKSSFVELVIPTNSDLVGKTLRQFDFRRRFRAAPLAIRSREDVLHDQLQEVQLRAGDVILAEMKSHYIDQWKRSEKQQNLPFLLLSEQGIVGFNRGKFWLVISILAGVIGLASLNILPIVMSTLLGVCALVITKALSMKEVYRAIQWPIIFLLAGALSLGVAMNNSGLANDLANLMLEHFRDFGPVIILSGIYILTSLLTEVMSNNATAALIAPISLAIAANLGVSPAPFLIATMFAASLSFMTPIGYQTNTMIYSAGGYRFRDFIKIGVWLNLIFWIMSTLLIPVFFPF